MASEHSDWCASHYQDPPQCTCKPESLQIVCGCEEGSVDEEDAKNNVSPSIFKIYDNGNVECVECGSTYRWDGKSWRG